MKIPQKRDVSVEARKKLNKKLIITTILFLIPSVFLGYEMVKQEMQESTVIYENTGNNFDIEKIQKKLQVIYPKIQKVQVGYMEQWDATEEKPQKRLSVVIYSDVSLAEKDKMIIRKWMEVEVQAEDIVFLTTDQMMSGTKEEVK